MCLEEQVTKERKMRVVVQRVINSHVEVDGKTIGSIGKGFMLLIGVEVNDTTEDADYIVNKVSGLRIFEDDAGKMNLSIQESKGEILAISQFTLLADSRHGRRPSFINAELPEKANNLYEYTCDKFKQNGIHVEKGSFGADMKVHLINDGPVTILLDSKKLF